MKSNTLTIIKKEFARFFGDRQMLFTTVIMPGLLIYIIYSIMGMGMKKMATEGTNELVTLCVENMPASVAPLIDGIPAVSVSQQAVSQEDIDKLEDKNLNVVLVRFPEAFDVNVATFDPQSGIASPNVEIYYNSANNASSRVYHILEASLSAYEDQLSNRFDINRADSEEVAFDKANKDDVLGSILSKLIPMLILMMLFSGVMAIAPSSIAGEKERGTIATLLVTPLKRNELALGKVVSLSGIALLSGISSFIGIVLSLPKMIQADEVGVELGLNYTGADYTVLLLIILSSVLIMASAVSLLSALAKDVKNAGTMITPFMLVVMFCGLTPMFQSGTPESLTAYLIPFYNAIQVMTAVFAHEMKWMPVIVTLAANVVYTGIAVWGLTRMFNSEKVMFSK
ncbi:MAG: ABC transporter permease [Bacteroidales bacterium]|nr:ABC transporter permease [Bacteroidales bacterium]MBQ6730053.1 ABC transporter permease [Bacteroidales bacterium]